MWPQRNYGDGVYGVQGMRSNTLQKNEEEESIKVDIFDQRIQIERPKARERSVQRKGGAQGRKKKKRGKRSVWRKGRKARGGKERAEREGGDNIKKGQMRGQTTEGHREDKYGT